MTENSMENSRMIELMVKKMGKSASGEELAELERLLVENPAYSYMAEIVESLRGNNEHIEKNVPGSELAETGWRQLSGLLKAEQGEHVEGERSAETGDGRPTSQGPETREQPEASIVGPTPEQEIKTPAGVWQKMTPMWRVAAAIVVMAGALLVWYYGRKSWSSDPAYVYKSIDVTYGRRAELELSDGTRVLLNAGSRLKYPEAFSGSAREVILEGEGYFDVAQEADHPFLVHAGKITVKVLGTQFDVKAYKEDAELSTTLISGKVQVMLNDDPEKKIVLSSHEKLTVVNGKTRLAEHTKPAAQINGIARNALSYQVQLLPVAGRDSLSETAWLENKLVFNNQPFGDVARLLERKYDVQIDFSNEGLRQEHLSGVFEKETIEQVFDILRMTTRFTYTIKGKQIRLATNR
jgi:ferric-dicitrate binding protein FerR (iron transport regulator)